MNKETDMTMKLNPYFKDTLETSNVVWSHDENSYQFNFDFTDFLCDKPFELTDGKPRILLEFLDDKNADVQIYPLEIESEKLGHAYFIIPEQVLGYVGNVKASLSIDFSNKKYDLGNFMFKMKKSAIDNKMPKLQFYVDEFEKAQEIFQQGFDKVDSDIKESNAKVDEIKDLIVKNDVLKKVEAGPFGDFREWDDTLIAKMRNEFTERGVNIKWFGANEKNDDNTKTINDAIEFAQKNNIPSVIVPAGIFKVRAVNLTILLKSNVNIVGVHKEKSVLKISEKTGDWGYMLIGGQKELLENVTIKDLTLDCNVDNVITKTERWQNSNRVLINLGECKNCCVKNCHFVTNGIWGIRAFSENGKFENCSFNFIPPTYENASFDLSTIWVGGQYNRITNNTLIANWRSDFIPETAIETQGHFSYYDNNIVRGYKVGIIESSNTGYENPLNPIKDYGANSNVIINNTLECLVGGVTLWAMYTVSEAVIEGLRINNNKIKVLEGNNIKSRYRYGIGIFKANLATGATHDGVQLGKLMNTKINDNIIEFENRVVSDSLSMGDTGIKLDTEFEVENTNISNNCFVNIGGFGICLNYNLKAETNPNFQIIKNTSIIGNDFLNCRLPIRINTGVKRTTIQSNSFRQQIEYENVNDNMLITIEAYPKDTAYTETFDIRNNIIQSSIKYHRPFYPMYELPIALSKYSRDFDSILELNEPGTLVSQGTTERPKIIQANNFLLDKNNVRKAAVNTIQSTIGTPYGVDKTDVKIVSSSARFLEVNDALDFKPSQTIVIQKTDNSYSVVSILAVYKNYLYVASADSIKNAKVGHRITFYSDNLKVIS